MTIYRYFSDNTVKETMKGGEERIRPRLRLKWRNTKVKAIQKGI